MNKPLKVGFLVDGHGSDYQTYDLINYVSENDAFEKPIIITGYRESLKTNGDNYYKTPLIFFKKLKKIFFNFLVRKIRKIEVKKVRNRWPNYLKSKPLNTIKNMQGTVANVSKTFRAL